MQTDRLLLQRPHTGHIQQIYDGWAQDAAVTKYLTWVIHGSIDDTRKYINSRIVDWETGKSFMQLVRANNNKRQLAGAIHSRMTPHGISFGYLMAREFWGQGFMSEALAYMSTWWLQQDGVYRVYAHCHTDNIASAKVMENSGFS